MAYDFCKTVLKFNILGYMSNGDMVPEVIITEENLSKTGLMAIDASKQVNLIIGFGTAAFSISYGSIISKNPSSYVDIRVAKVAMSFNAVKSSTSVTSKVLTSNDSLSEQNRRGFLSMKVNCFKCCRNDFGVSEIT